MSREQRQELTVWIAEHVMGWVWRRSNVTGKRALYAPGEWPEWMNKPADMTEPLTNDFWECVHFFMPQFPTDISAAFEVVAAMRAKGFDFVLQELRDTECRAIFKREPFKQWSQADGPYVSIAICLAARAALESTNLTTTPKGEKAE